jgi:hypothetical protein
MTNGHGAHHDAALRAVQKARELVDALEGHVHEMHGQKVVQSTINDIRHELRIVFDATTRDGRMAGWYPGGGMGRMVFPQPAEREAP